MILGQEKPGTPQELAHHGVKGMKWGVRKEYKPTGRSSIGQKIATSMTEEQIKKHQQALSGKGVIGNLAKLDKGLMGKTKFEAMHNEKISQLERSKERIAKGELVSKTILWGPQYSKDQPPSNSKETEAQRTEKYKQLSGIEPKLSAKEHARLLAEDKQKFASKFEKSDAESDKEHHLSSKQKKIIGATVLGAAAAGLVLYSVKSGKGKSVLSEISKDAASIGGSGAGKPISSAAYHKAVSKSISASWGGKGYIQPSSYLQEELRFPAGHVFNRLSKFQEDSFGSATYSTHSVEDLNRYINSFRHELGGGQLHHITFTAKEEVRVPTLTKTLDTMLATIREVNPSATEKQALDQYRSMSGGKWQGNLADRFFRNLESQGYHGIVDQMDAGVIGESPLVIFKPSAFSNKTSIPLTKEAIAKAESSLIEINNRKL